MLSSEIIYGINPVIEMLSAGRRACREVFIADGRKSADADRVRELASKRGAKIKILLREEISLLSGTEKNQGVATRCDPYPYAEISEIIDFSLRDENKGFVLILDGITDPQNLGSLARCRSEAPAGGRFAGDRRSSGNAPLRASCRRFLKHGGVDPLGIARAML